MKVENAPTALRQYKGPGGCGAKLPGPPWNPRYSRNLLRQTGIRPAFLGVVHRQGAVVEVGLVVADQRQDFLGEIHDRDLVAVTDVDRLGVVAQQEAVDAFDQVVHVTEGAGLATVAENSQIFTS